MESEYRMPPKPENTEGAMRTLGIELEFASEDGLQLAELVNRLFEGKIDRIDPHLFKIRDTPLGTFTIELDTQYVHWKKPESAESDWMDELLPKELFDDLIEALGDVMKYVVPYELVTPPIPLDRLPECDRLLAELRKLKLKGTDEGFFYAFGMHLNPEVAEQNHVWILDVLRAYLLVADWLHEQMGIDLARKLSPYIRACPEPYILKVLQPKYQPDEETFIRDYVKFNDTRNRELDLFPLLSHINEPLMQKLVTDDLTKPRPTFHLRLPDCRLNDPDWSISHHWNLWVQVEELADDKARLEAMSLAYIQHADKLFKGKWAQKIPEFLNR
ncbi:amidoligase family protein [Nitrospina watsonii]|uniref:Amidoligase enzyme n=1 Tax=Nitrospina watsonii TaxID=1323948 RepID=A0ABN8W3X4_9BACT|nr:amidoligase family protein [Nitrospina watsonii]CAI2719505.1 conserved protein of unknown function [Nitrospina watsonii]